MTIDRSIPDKYSQSLTILYSDLPEDKFAGVQLEIQCRGFKNPIAQGLWPGFAIILFDNEPNRNAIEVSQIYSFNANDYTPA